MDSQQEYLELYTLPPSMRNRFDAYPSKGRSLAPQLKDQGDGSRKGYEQDQGWDAELPALQAELEGTARPTKQFSPGSRNSYHVPGMVRTTGSSIGPTRTEADFAAHITQTIQRDPKAICIFVTDQLTTHQSESLVRLVAEQCGIQDDLGIKGKSGHPFDHEHPCHLSLRSQPSHSLCLHPHT